MGGDGFYSKFHKGRGGKRRQQHVDTHRGHTQPKNDAEYGGQQEQNGKGPPPLIASILQREGESHASDVSAHR